MFFLASFGLLSSLLLSAIRWKRFSTIPFISPRLTLLSPSRSKILRNKRIDKFRESESIFKQFRESESVYCKFQTWRFASTSPHCFPRWWLFRLQGTPENIFRLWSERQTCPIIGKHMLQTKRLLTEALYEVLRHVNHLKVDWTNQSRKMKFASYIFPKTQEGLRQKERHISSKRIQFCDSVPLLSKSYILKMSSASSVL